MKKFFEILNKAELAIIMTHVMGFTSVLVLEAAVCLTGHPLSWRNDTILLMLAWITLLGGDVAFRIRRMVNVDILIDKPPVVLQKAVALIMYAVLLVMMFMMVRQGLQLCVNVSKRTPEGIPPLSYVWAAASTPAGSPLMLVAAVKHLYDFMKTIDSTVVLKM